MWLLSVDFVDVETPTLFRRTPGVSNIFIFIMRILKGTTHCFDDVVCKLGSMLGHKKSVHQFLYLLYDKYLLYEHL